MATVPAPSMYPHEVPIPPPANEATVEEKLPLISTLITRMTLLL